MAYICNNCDFRPLPPGSMYCPGCGAKFDRPTPSKGAGSQVVKCGRCGGDGVDPGSRGFAADKCEGCGGTGWARL